MPTSTLHLGIFTCRKATTWDRRLYFPSEIRRAEDFSALKIRRLRPGANPRTWVAKVSTLPLDHRSRSTNCKASHFEKNRNHDSHCKVPWNCHSVVSNICHVPKLRAFLISKVGDSKLHFFTEQFSKGTVFVLVRNSIILTLKRINTPQKFRHREFFDCRK